MVKYTFLYICVLFCLYSYGQNKEFCDKDTDLFTMSALDKFPCYNKSCKGNSEKDLFKFIKKSINYPQSALHDLIEGTVIIGFIVELDGSTTQHKILTGVRDDINKEALRIIKLIKYAEPAKQANKSVRVKMVLPIKFSISTSPVRRSVNSVKLSSK